MLYHLSHVFDEIKNQITKEISTSLNIKNKINKKKVNSSLKMILNYIKKINTLGASLKNGIAIYSGINDLNEEIFEFIILDIPIKNKIYSCDKQFHIDFLYNYINIDNKKYLVIYLDGNSTYYYEKNMTDLKQIKSLHFDRQKKQKKGGQSQNRIARLRVEKIDNFISKSIYTLNNYINENKEYEAILIFGNGDIINGIKSNKNIIYEFTGIYNNKIHFSKLIDKNILYDKCEELINNILINNDENCIKKYMDLLTINSDILIFGYDNIIKNIIYIDEILLLKDSKYYEILKKNDNLNNKIKIINNDNINFLINFDGVIGKLYYVNINIEED